MRLFCPAFTPGGEIPLEHTGEGADLSPTIEWLEVPAKTQEFVLIMEDPDAPTKVGHGHGFIHWLVYDLASTARGLEQGVPSREVSEIPIHLYQGKNSFKRIGYSGPYPPTADPAHRYFFRLYALDQRLGLNPGVEVSYVVKAMEGHILERAEYLGTYARKKIASVG